MLNWEEGEGHYHFMLCFAIFLHSQSCTSRERVIFSSYYYLFAKRKGNKAKGTGFFEEN